MNNFFCVLNKVIFVRMVIFQVIHILARDTTPSIPHLSEHSRMQDPLWNTTPSLSPQSYECSLERRWRDVAPSHAHIQTMRLASLSSSWCSMVGRTKVGKTQLPADLRQFGRGVPDRAPGTQEAPG
jgi:hypothetical protein